MMAQDKTLREIKKETEQSIALMRLMVRHRYKIWAAYAVLIGALLWVAVA